jgi:hypothetical protein
LKTRTPPITHALRDRSLPERASVFFKPNKDP